MCGSSVKINIFFDYYETTLQADILSRQGEDVYYNEEELREILAGAVKALQYLNNNDITHGDISPETIYLDLEGKSRILDNQFLTHGLTGYSRFYFKQSPSCYLSPKQLTALKTNSESTSGDQEKSDVFSLGMTIIYAANLKDIQNLYDLENFKLNKKNIDSSLKEIKRRYSKKFVKVLKKMIAKNESKRLSLKDLAKQLRKLARRQLSSSENEVVAPVMEDGSGAKGQGGEDHLQVEPQEGEKQVEVNTAFVPKK